MKMNSILLTKENMIVISIVIMRSEMVPDTLFGVPEMMDTPPLLNNYAFYFAYLLFLLIVHITPILNGLSIF